MKRPKYLKNGTVEISQKFLWKTKAHKVHKNCHRKFLPIYEGLSPYFTGLCSNREQRNNGKLSGIEVVDWILYADDVVLFCKTPEEAEQLLIIINDTCKRFGFFKKTKTQV